VMREDLNLGCPEPSKALIWMEASPAFSHLLGGLDGPLILTGAVATAVLAKRRIDALVLAFAISIFIMPLLLVIALNEGWPPSEVPLATLVAFTVTTLLSQSLLFVRWWLTRRRPGKEG
jgi:uncharacterized membrane protein